MLVIGKGRGEILQRLFQGVRTQSDIAQQTQCAGLELLAVAQAEIVATGLPRRLFQHLAVVGQGQAQGRMEQLLRIDSSAAEDTVQVATLIGDETVEATGGRRQHADVARRGRLQAGTGKQRRVHHGLPSLFLITHSSKTHAP
ncbi:hypothetical protein D9M68_751550 [compost metagenome]